MPSRARARLLCGVELSVFEQLPINGVRDPSLEAPDRFEGLLALGSLAPVVGLALTEAAAAKRRVYALVRTAMAVPLRLLALAWIVLCPIALLGGRNHLGPAVGIALLAVTAVSWLRYRRVARERGVRAHLWPWLAVALIALGGGGAASRAGTGHGLAWLNIAGPFVVNALALLALAGFVRSRAIGIAAVTMLAMSFIVASTLSGDVAVAVQLAAYAAVLLVASARMTR